MEKWIRGAVVTVALGLWSIGSVTATEEVIYYHNDALGSPIMATDESGNVKWREEYAPYGSRLVLQAREDDSGNPPAPVESIWDEKQWFTGKLEETRVGLQYFGARWYEPEIGRFLSPDPVEFQEGNHFSFNRYAYANNNPYRFTDPDGNNPIVFKLGVDFTLNVALNVVTTGNLNLGGAAQETLAGALNPVKTLKTAGKLASAFGSKVTKGPKFAIDDGVRRAKSADLLGNKTIPARIKQSGKPDVFQEVPVSSLRSPKSEIPADSRFFDQNFNPAKNGSIPPPIEIRQITSEGPGLVPIRNVDLIP